MSFFSTTDKFLINKIFSYETTENLYKYTCLVSKRWRKAALLEIFSRFNSSEDIFNQENLLKEYIHIDKDDEFYTALYNTVIASMNSKFSTAIHKLNCALFLCHFHEVPDGSIPDGVMELFGWIYSNVAHDYDYSDHCFLKDTYHQAAVLASILPQAQIDRIISGLILQLNDESTKYDHSAFLHGILLLSPRIKPDLSNTIISLMIQRLKDSPHNTCELKVLRAFVSKMDSAQIDVVISTLLVNLGSQLVRHDYISDHLIIFAAMATPAQAFTAFTIGIRELLKEYSFWRPQKFLRAFAPRLDKDQIKTLMTIHMNPKPNKYEIYPLLEVLAPIFTSEQAYALCLDLIPNLRDDNKTKNLSNILDVLITRLEPEQAQNIITMSLSKLTTKIEVFYSNDIFSGPILLMTPEEIDNEREKPKGKYLDYNCEALNTLTLLRSHLNPEQISAIVETMLSILNSKSSTAIFCQYYYALRTITEFISQLTEPLQINIILTTLQSILDNDMAMSEHSNVFNTFIALGPKLTQSQIDIIFPNVISVLSNKHYRSDSTHEITERNALDLFVVLIPKLADDQIDRLYMAVQMFDTHYVSDDLVNTLLNTITALACRLNITQANELLTKSLSLSLSYRCKDSVKLRACSVLVDKLALIEIPTTQLLSRILNDGNDCCSQAKKLNFYKNTFKVIIKLLPVLNPDEIQMTFDWVLRGVERHPELIYKSSIALYTAISLSPKLEQEQVNQYLIAHQNPLATLVMFKLLTSRLVGAQIDTALTHIIAQLHGSNSKMALNVLTTLIPRLETEEQITKICLNVSSLLCNPSILNECHDTRFEVLVVLNALLMANKIDYAALQHQLISNATLNPSPCLEEAKVILAIINNSQKNLIQQQDYVINTATL